MKGCEIGLTTNLVQMACFCHPCERRFRENTKALFITERASLNNPGDFLASHSLFTVPLFSTAEISEFRHRYLKPRRCIRL